MTDRLSTTMHRVAGGFMPLSAVFALSLAASPLAFAVDSAAACKAFTETFIEENNLLPARDARNDAFTMCVSGLQGAQRLLEVSTAENMAHCDLELNSYLNSRGLGVPPSDTWREAMTVCANGDAQSAKLYLAEVQLGNDNIPSPVVTDAPPPDPNELTRQILAGAETETQPTTPSIGRRQAAAPSASSSLDAYPAPPMPQQMAQVPASQPQPVEDDSGSFIGNFFGSIFGGDEPASTMPPPATSTPIQPTAPQGESTFSTTIAPQSKPLDATQVDAARRAARAATLTPPDQSEATPETKAYPSWSQRGYTDETATPDYTPPAAPLQPPPSYNEVLQTPPQQPSDAPQQPMQYEGGKEPWPYNGLTQGEIDAARDSINASLSGEDLPEATRPTLLPSARAATSAPQPIAPAQLQAPVQAPMRTTMVSPQSAPKPINVQNTGPRTIDQCIPALDRIDVDEWLSPSGLDFQAAVGKCMKGDMVGAVTTLRASHAKTAARCEPMLNGFIEEMGLAQPGRMVWKTAMDLCANGRDTAAQNELTRVGFAESAGRGAPPGAAQPQRQMPLPSPQPMPQPSKYPTIGPQTLDLQAVPVDPMAVGNARVMGEDGDATLRPRSSCVSELNTYMLDNKLVAAKAKMEQAIMLCRQNNNDAAAAALNAAHRDAVAKCEVPLYQFVKERNLNPTQRWWYGAMGLCADGKMQEAYNMLQNAVSDNGARTSTTPSSLGGSGGRATSLVPIKRDTVRPTVPENLTATIAPGADCVSILNRMVGREDLTLSDGDFQRAVDACIEGNTPNMQKIARLASSQTMDRCEGPLRDYISQYNLSEPSDTLWKQALQSCANGSVAQAQIVLGH